MGYSSVSRPSSSYSGKNSTSSSSSKPKATTTTSTSKVTTSLSEVLELVEKSERIKQTISEHEKAIMTAQGELFRVESRMKEVIDGLDAGTKAQLKVLLEKLSASKENDNTK